MLLNFKKWFAEDATTTACVANFAMPIGLHITRPSISNINYSFNTKKKKKKKNRNI